MTDTNKRKRTRRDKVIFPTLKILTEQHVGENNGISNKRILEKLKNLDIPIFFSRNTMGDVLADLKANFSYGGTIKSKLGNTPEEDGKTYAYNYYFEPYLSQEELQCITDDIMISGLHSQKKGKALVEKLKLLVPPVMRNKVDISKICTTSNVLLDERTEQNISFINDIIRYNDKTAKANEEMRVRFTMKGYGFGKEMKPVVEKNGKVRIYEILPFAVAEMRNKYYMLGYKKGSKTVSIHRIDLLFDLEEKLYADVEKDTQKQALKNQVGGEELKRFVSQHQLASYDHKHTYIVRAKAQNGFFTYARDLLGPDVELRPVKDKPDEAEFIYTCPQRTMEIYARQYMGFLRVVGPAAEKEAIEKVVAEMVLEDEGYKAQILKILEGRREKTYEM